MDPITTPAGPLERATGCLLGSACGDALGAPVEFQPWKAIQTEYGRAGVREMAFGPYGHGGITDDTQMAIAVGEAILRCRTPFLQEELERSLRTELMAWMHRQQVPGESRAPGVQCMAGCHDLELEECYGRRPSSPDLDGKARVSGGCGTTMRVHPVALAFRAHQHLQDRVALLQAGLTHPDPAACRAAVLQARLVAYALEGRPVSDAVETVVADAGELAAEDPAYAPVVDALEHALSLARTRATDRQIIHRLGSGAGAVDALAITAAICWRRSTDYLTGVRAAVNHDGDSDSVGAMVGAVLGAACPWSIPERWLSPLEARHLLESLAWGLTNLHRAHALFRSTT